MGKLAEFSGGGGIFAGVFYISSHS